MCLDNDYLAKRDAEEMGKIHEFLGLTVGVVLNDMNGVNQSTGEIDPTLDIDKATNQKYSSNANYIIFRNIDLSSDNWTSLMFQGTMIGSKGDGKSTLWNNDTSVIDYSKATDLNIGDKPVISNVNVSQTSELDVGEQMGDRKSVV